MTLRATPRHQIETDGRALAARLLDEGANDDVAGAIVRAFAHGQAVAFNLARGRRTCRICGCWEFAACPGRCWWVDDDLCSSCVTETITIDPAKEA
jgi:hypothetical protein